jgi:hypothetical protein
MHSPEAREYFDWLLSSWRVGLDGDSGTEATHSGFNVIWNQIREFRGLGDRNVVLYGARMTGEVAYRACKAEGLNIVTVVDGDPNLQGDSLAGEMASRIPTSWEKSPPIPLSCARAGRQSPLFEPYRI